MASKTILFVTRNYPPLVGGMERLVWRLTRHVPGPWSYVLVGPRGAGPYSPSALKVLEAPVSPVPLFLVWALAESLFAARRYGVDYVIAGSGAVAPLARLAAKVSGCGYAVLVHGLDLVIDSRMYRRFFLPSIAAADVVIANSRNTRRLAVRCGVPEERTRVVLPGVEEPVHGDSDFRQIYGLGKRPVMLFLGRLIPRKGLVEFIERSLPAVLDRVPDAMFVIAGSEPGNALFHRAGLLAEIRDTASRLGVEGHVLITGSLTEERVAAAYRAADVFVFPLVETPGDVEGFGMVALEAAICGTPTVAFRVGGVADAVADGKSGYLHEPGDYAGFSDRVTALLTTVENPPVTAEECRAFARGFTWEKYAREVLQALAAVDR